MTSEKSRSKRIVARKTPGGRVSVRRVARKPEAAKCAECGKPLKGVPRELPSKMRNLPKTAKRPERPFGGYLCSSCMRKLMVKKARE
ncbi:50S ribosomal protein L34e [Candidatus Woesearchaeota archaeon]|nr:MAG: 50S ribosomal protein L34e [Candidatus Woesearchaeota archaeon]